MIEPTQLNIPKEDHLEYQEATQSNDDQEMDMIKEINSEFQSLCLDEKDESKGKRQQDLENMMSPASYIQSLEQQTYQRMMQDQPGPHENKRKRVISKEPLPLQTIKVNRSNHLHGKRLFSQIQNSNQLQGQGGNNLLQQRRKFGEDQQINSETQLRLESKDQKYYIDFQVFQDDEIGLESLVVQKENYSNIEEHDYNSDEDEMKCGKMICYKDLEKSMYEAQQTGMGFMKFFLRNNDINQRIAQPQNYDRFGKLQGYDEKAFNPINQILSRNNNYPDNMCQIEENDEIRQNLFEDY